MVHYFIDPIEVRVNTLKTRIFPFRILDMYLRARLNAHNAQK